MDCPLLGYEVNFRIFKSGRIFLSINDILVCFGLHLVLCPLLIDLVHFIACTYLE